MDRKSLLKVLDRLPHRQRLSHVIALARSNSQNPKLVNLLDSLVCSSYEWRLRQAMAFVLGDVERLLSGLSHSCPFVRGASVSMLPRLSELRGELLIGALESMDQQTRRSLLRKIRQLNRRDLAEALLPALWERFGPREAALVLPALGPETVRAKLPELAHELRTWTTLAGRYPDIVLEYLGETLRQKPSATRARVWRHLRGAFRPLLFKRTDQLLALAEETAPAEVYPQHFGSHWGVLTRRFPSRIAELLCRAEIRKGVLRMGLPSGLVRNFRAFQNSDRLRLAKTQRERPEGLAHLLDALAPRERGGLFDAILEGQDCSQCRWPEHLMRVLPHPLRAREVQRMLALRVVSENAPERVRVLGFLPPESARELLLEEARTAQAEERAAALSSLVRSTALYRRELGGTLQILQRLKNEQDPVRLAVLNELSKLPGKDFQIEHSELIENLVVAVVDARDSSYGTRKALSRLLNRIVQTHPYPGSMFDFALKMLEKLGWQGFQLEMNEVFHFEPQRCRLFIRKLLPLAKEAVARESYELLFALSRFEAAWEVGELQDLLETASRAKPEWTARQAISHWLKNPKTRDLRVQKLLSKDRSHIVLWEVLHHLHRRRQDLLDPFLTQKAIRGRFLPGRCVYVMSLHEGFERWLPRQQEAFAKQLLSLATDKEQALSTRAGAVARLSRLPDVSAELSEKFLQAPEQALKEASLASPRMNLGRLLPYFERDEARVAAYTLATALRRSSPVEVGRVLKEAFSLPLKVTAHKELVRILGQCRGPYSLPLLEREWGKENLHRDVRIAVVHALRNLLDLAESWKLLEEAAELAEAEVHRALLSQRPDELLPGHRFSYLELLLSLQDTPDLKIRRELWLQLAPWIEVDSHKIARAAVNCFSLLENSDWARAADLLLLCSRQGRQADSLLEGVKALYQQSEEEPQATPERDRPARQRLNYLAHQLLSFPEPSRRLLQTLFASLSPYYEEPETVFRLRWAGGEELKDLIASCGRGYEEQRGLLRAFNTEWSRAQEEPEKLLQVALDWSLQESGLARRLAVEALLQAGPRLGWSEPCRELLRRLRQDREADVALAARRIFIAQEL